MSSSLRAVVAVRPLHGRVLFLGRSCFPVTRATLSFTRYVPSSWSSEHTYIPGLRHLSSGRVRNEQYPPKGQFCADDSDTANAVCSHSDAEAASQTAESSAATPGSASSVSEGKTRPSLSGLSVDSNPAQSPPAAHLPPLSTTIDAVSGVNMAENKAGSVHPPEVEAHRVEDVKTFESKAAQTFGKGPQMPSSSSDSQAGRPSVAGNSKKEIRCFYCRGPHHFKDCPQGYMLICAACHGSHHARDCPERNHIKPLSPCSFCGSMDHWSVDCTAPMEVQETYRKQCFICRQRGHIARDCTRRAEHKPSKPCPACGGPGHWIYDCPQIDKKTDFQLRECAYCGGPHDTKRCWKLRAKRVRQTNGIVANHKK